MAASNKNLLLVEGKGEQYALPFLLDQHTEWGDKKTGRVVEIKELGGVDEILKPGVIEGASKTSGLKALGIIIDANDSFISRWNRVKERCQRITQTIPEDIPPTGLILTTARGLRIGVWIMPDNESRGMMETFLARLLLPECAPIWALATSSCEAVRTHKHSHKIVHKDKAEIHTYLAWIEPPGLSLPDAILKNAIDARLPLAAHFVSWFMTLFDLAPRKDI